MQMKRSVTKERMEKTYGNEIYKQILGNAKKISMCDDIYSALHRLIEDNLKCLIDIDEKALMLTLDEDKQLLNLFFKFSVFMIGISIHHEYFNDSISYEDYIKPRIEKLIPENMDKDEILERAISTLRKKRDKNLEYNSFYQLQKNLSNKERYKRFDSQNNKLKPIPKYNLPQRDLNFILDTYSQTNGVGLKELVQEYAMLLDEKLTYDHLEEYILSYKMLRCNKKIDALKFYNLTEFMRKFLSQHSEIVGMDNYMLENKLKAEFYYSILLKYNNEIDEKNNICIQDMQYITSLSLIKSSEIYKYIIKNKINFGTLENNNIKTYIVKLVTIQNYFEDKMGLVAELVLQILETDYLRSVDQNTIKKAIIQIINKNAPLCESINKEFIINNQIRFNELFEVLNFGNTY